ncbi:tRNA isopentenyltransferase [Pisolithus croceorrhizus]|nr:tRNA isopentenyltransferase [Pisolithus croceorrhizus]
MASSLQPLVVICGATGVGKSKLGVELALRLMNQGHNRWRGARIINADSMQVYTGLNVVTNKISPAERMGIDHLLMDFKRPEEQYPVGQWVHDAMRAINETHNRNEIPIVVAMTRLVYLETNIPIVFGLLYRNVSLRNFLLISKLFDHLPEHALDEPVAARWHWGDTRKLLRALQIIKEQGRTPSEIINERASTPLFPRYRTLCFWLHAEQSVLDRRLDERVDDMIKNGLLQEIRELYEYARTSVDLEAGHDEHRNHFTVGLFQSIGYKELYKFISDPDVSEGSFADAVEQTKHSTREYAKRQVTGLWNMLLPAIHRVTAECRGKSPAAALYLLDASVLGESWISNVFQPARTIMNAFLNEEELPDPTTLSPLAQAMLSDVNKSLSPSAVLEARRKVVCPLCTKNPSQPVMVECDEREAHQRTRLHRRLVTKAKGRISSVPWKHEASE